MSTQTAFHHLVARGLIDQATDEEALARLLQGESVPLYIGFDPTAASLHVGHLLPIMVLMHMQRSGHQPIVLVGGATGLIGDPSGRDTERQLLTDEMVARNVAGIQRQLEQFLDFGGENAAVVVNNNDWIQPLSAIEWLRDVGKHFTVNYMLAKESVQRRVENREQGLSYTEFSYMLLQAYDFLHLHRSFGCMSKRPPPKEVASLSVREATPERGSHAYENRS